MNKQNINRNQIIGCVLTIVMVFAAEARSVENGKIAFTSERDDIRQIFVMNPDGSNQTRLTNGQFDEYDAAFSRDGRKIAFASDRNGSHNPEIYVMNADGSDQIRLTDNAGSDVRPTWSPDGTRIVFIHNNTEIRVIRADGSGQVTIYLGLAFETLPHRIGRLTGQL